MTDGPAELRRLVPDAPEALLKILDADRGPVEQPIRSEIFGPERFAQHGRSLGETHAARYAGSGSAAFFPRLRDNIRVLREAHRYIGSQATTGYDVSPAAEWLLDNFHLVEAQLREIHEGLPRRYFRALPMLQDEPLVGLPRIYGVAWAFVAHTDSAFDEDLLVRFLGAYQQTRELTLGELWALPTTLRVVLIENLRRLAERVATNKAARALANLCCDRIETYGTERLDALLALLVRRGVGDAFLVQMAQRLLDRHGSEDARWHEWLQAMLPDPGGMQTRQPVGQAADNLSVSNAISSLRSIGDADWPDIVARTSVLIQLMLTSPAFEADRDDTRDQILHAIEKLARHSGRSERVVAQTLLDLMHRPATVANGESSAIAGYWIRGPGRTTLARALGMRPRRAWRWRRWGERAALPAYLVTLALMTFVLVVWLLPRHGAALGAGWLALAALLTFFPASETAVAVVNRLISESLRPRRLPRLALAAGIPAEHRVLVVIPAMLLDKAEVHALVQRLQAHYLANPERQAQFALLTDWADAPTEQRASDDVLLGLAVREIGELNARYPADGGQAPRFIVLHRSRRWSDGEQRWMGRERKRGKIEDLLIELVEAPRDRFIDLGEWSRLADGTRYLVSLDSDTRLPPGRLRDLVGVAAHPQNRPRLAAGRRRVVAGYAILQPRVVTPLPAPAEITLYHWLFGGQPGIDPYSAATSEVYQDLFGEGTYTGKGLLDVQAAHAVLARRFPDNQVLSHDLLEGALARCAAVTDITVIEEAPFHADVAASRVHRWTRGDWQLLPFLLRPRRYGISAVNRWKMLDNLRRSLVAPMSVGLVLLALASGIIAPWAALTLVFAAFAAGPLLGALAGMVPSREDIARQRFYRLAFDDLARAVLGGVWRLAQLLQLALMALDAVLRALHRTLVSRRHLLEWTTAAAAQASASTDLTMLLRRHWGAPIAALGLLVLLVGVGTPYPWLSLALCAIWGASGFWNWWVSRPWPPREKALTASDEAYLERMGRDTWRLFERYVGAADNFLPPDNVQLTPFRMVAHRTSPTNIGLYLLSVACARRFGWIGTQDLIERLEATLASLALLPRHRGHFLNWYDTATLQALHPAYVSTVDSGNLSGHLLAVAEACDELALAPYDETMQRHAIAASARRIDALGGARLDAVAHAALLKLLAFDDPLAQGRTDPDGFDHLLEAAGAELAPLLPDDDVPAGAEQDLLACLADHLAMLRSARRDARARESAPNREDPVLHDAMRRLQGLAVRCQQLTWEADFAFLYNRKRRLFHIGLRVAELQLDTSYYDLLASEARLTSLVAIAKGDVPVAHWSSLGRPFYAVGALAGLRSWSGSMFEYLMPSLVLDEPQGSVLQDACEAAVREQIAFGHERGVPWGVSESAYAASDHTLAYQYAPQGVPRLALRRTPHDELVIAPYATALATQVMPHAAVRNLEQLEVRDARARYGFMEALDFSPLRQAPGGGATLVNTFMAHHQGMSIVALANVLLHGAPRRWGMANAHIDAVASLLHERAPRQISVLLEPPLPPPLPQQRRIPRMLRQVVPGMAAVEPTHLLSNGRYSVALRANGAGWSRLGANGITRWRDDALRDAYGSFFHLRWDRQPRPVSLTQHPAADAAAHYESSFQADRICFTAAWSELEAQTTVWVSPEDDIEFREVVLRNLGDRALDLELMSAFEVTLADERADEAHPAFSNLFVRAEWQAAHQALWFERRPRLPTDKPLLAAHFLVAGDAPMLQLQLQTDRARWLGRNRGASQPRAELQPPPILDLEARDETLTLDTGLDPMCVLAARLQLEGHSKVKLTFCTAAADDAAALRAIIDKYRQPSHVERASLMSATLTGIRLRDMRINSETYAAIQTLTTALVLSLTRLHVAGTAAGTVCDRRLLWRFGLSGERPIILVTAGAPQGLGLLRSLAQALRIWSFAGVACDLVVVNAEPSSYLMALQREIAALRERYLQGGESSAGFHLLQTSELSADERSTLRALARVRLNADGRPLAHHVQEWVDLHDVDLMERSETSQQAVPAERHAAEPRRTPAGEFAPDSGEFRFHLNAFAQPARPWVNVLANPEFGAQLSEAGGGYTWGVNSRLNQLTPWSNDPVSDPPGEWWLLQDLKTMQAWSVAPSAWGDATADYRVAHGQGTSTIAHRRGDLDVSASWCVDTERSVKQVQLRIVNRGARSVRLRAIGIVEWILGAARGDRSTTRTSLRWPEQANGTRLLALTCTQRERAAGFGDGTAFLALAGASGDSTEWSCDRREFFDARGLLVLPDHFGLHSGAGLDPCAGLASSFSLKPGETVERVFLLGYGASPDAAWELAVAAAAVPAASRWREAQKAWDRLLGATTVRTPDPLFDALVNRWLLYQAVACRLWARAGFYQAGGAYGFRDQLQDAMALAWAAPEMLRRQIVLGASRQFVEGDVQHWWHAPQGAGVRTHFSDDLLWLPYATHHYLKTTADESLLDESVPFLEGQAIPEGAEDAYFTPGLSSEQASVYEHCARTLDRSLTAGAHGLPLMGTGDWNDGMNRVGSEGRGESVWLAWFLCEIVRNFAPVARRRGDAARALRWEDAARGWRAALQGQAWDGQWFRRAFFDDGSPLGSQANAECRIDLIAQAWSVLSNATPEAFQRIAMHALEARLVDHDAQLIRLLDPPLANARPSAGYIQAYPPGVRENGGQYAHAAVWALMAQAARGQGDLAWRYFTYLSPAHRSHDPDIAAAYAIEPYVMAGDIYSAPPYVGRGGWSWYTGSAAWLHRAAIESMFGLRQEGDVLRFEPCLPSHWHEAELTLRRDGRSLHVMLRRRGAGEADDAALAARDAARLLQRGEALHWSRLGADSRWLLLLGAASVVERAAAARTPA